MFGTLRLKNYFVIFIENVNIQAYVDLHYNNQRECWWKLEH